MIQRELKRVMLVVNYSKKRQEILFELKKERNLEKIFVLQKELQSMPPNSLPIRLRNRCWKTGRSRGVYRDFGLSRHVIREMAHQCLLPGLIKASW